MNISNLIFLKLAEKYKESSIKSFSYCLKTINCYPVTEKNLKGKIKGLCKTIEQKDLKNKKCYYNALYQCYSRCNYNEAELTYLKDHLGRSQIKSDEIRHKKKIEEREENFEGFTTTWTDLLIIKFKLRNIYYKSKLHSDLMNWLLVAFYTDEEFGPKRQSDIITLKKENFDKNCLHFKTIKNQFVYHSKAALSKDILEPIKLAIKKSPCEYILTNKKYKPLSSQHATIKIKNLLSVSSQYLRRLWASRHYSYHPRPNKLLEQAYELNHNITMHLTDYIAHYDNSDDDRYIVIKTMKFKKVINYQRILMNA